MRPDNDIFLSLHDLDVGYRDRCQTTVLLKGLNLQLRRGRLVALLGQNGAGKSTLLRAVTCATRPLAGYVELAGVGVDLHQLSYRERSRLVGLVTTERVLAGALTVRELVELGRQPYTGQLGRLDDHDHEVVDEALESVGIAHKREAMIADLSDGERQKVMIAKALAQRTPLIVLDEPTAFLDVASRIEMMTLLHRLAHEQGKAILLSSHDISQSLLLADELWVITADRSVVAGPTEEVVLSGIMGHVFTSEALAFNNELGDYEAVLPTAKSVSLDCDEPLLRRCLIAALLRHGVGVAPAANIRVRAASPTRFLVESPGRASHEVSSVPALLAHLCRVDE